MSQLDKPNVAFPLAYSYNTRGMDAFTNVFTNAQDQRKINVVYEPVENAATGKTTMYVVKRHGVAIDGNTWGTSGQAAYLVAVAAGATSTGSANHWLFSTNGNDIRVSNTATTTTVMSSAAGFAPVFVDKTNISGTENLVFQIRDTSDNQQAWYMTSIAAATRIVDADFPNPVGKMEFIDGYALALASNNRIHNSDLNSLDNWSASNYITKQITQDIPIGLARLGNQIIAFGARTMEVFRNVGNATGSPLEVVQSLYQLYGLPFQGTGSTHYYTNVDNRLYFVGKRGHSTSGPCFLSYNGQVIEKVSTPAIDKILSDTNYYSVNSVVITGGRVGIAISLDLTTATTQRWLMYFPDWKEWFEWNSTVFTPVNDGLLFLGVGSDQHRLYNPTIVDRWQDNTTAYTSTLQFKMPKTGNERSFMRWCGVVADSHSSTSSLSAGSSIAISFSDDDYETFGNTRDIDLRGRKKHIYRCGAYEDRAVRITHTGNAEFRASAFVAKVE